MGTSILGCVWVLQPCHDAARHPVLDKYHPRLSLSLILPLSFVSTFLPRQCIHWSEFY